MAVQNSPAKDDESRSYDSPGFWEASHTAVGGADVMKGMGVRHVGGGQNANEASSLYRLRKINLLRTLRKIGNLGCPKIFELGSGGGYWVDFFNHFNPASYVGSDISETAVRRLSETFPNRNFVWMLQDGAWNTIQQSGPFNLVLALDVLYHITDDAIWLESLHNLCKATKPGGHLIIIDYFNEQAIEKPKSVHVKHRSMQAHLNILEEHSFSVIELQPVFYFLNRIYSGPWRDHNRMLSPILRSMMSNSIGRQILETLDIVITKIVRPMNERVKAKILLAKRIEIASS